MRMKAALRAVGVALVAVALLGACAQQGPPDLTVDASLVYEGPPIESGAVDGQHALWIVAPTGGWEVRGEHVTRYFMDNRIYLTIVRPDPEEMQTQALVRFDVTPGVKIDEPLAVYARVVDYDADPDESRFAFATAISPRRP